MSLHNIKVPDIGEGITEVELVCWRVAIGEIVIEDQPLADVMTEKAAVEVPAPISGVVTAIFGEPGQFLAVGSVMLTISPNKSEVESSKREQSLVPASSDLLQTKLPETNSATVAQIYTTQVINHLEVSNNKRVLTSPSIRHHARQKHIDLSQIKGSAHGGRITRQDFDNYLQSRQNLSNTPTSIAAIANKPTSEQITTIPLIGLRRKIAQKMQESKRNIAHFSYVEEIDVENLEQLREQLNNEFALSRIKLTMLPLIIRAIALAVVKFPQLNAHFDQENQVIKQFNLLHIGIATQSNSGLLVPVIRNVSELNLWQIADQIKQLSELTRQGKAGREILSGSTMTITSLGALGGIVSTPVINAPEVAIVGVNRLVKRPVVIGEQINIRKMMNLSSSFDHRIIDGMDAAKFIQEIKRLLENPAILLC